MSNNSLKLETLEGVEKTLIIPLWARAEETKTGGLINDQLSVEIINEIDTSLCGFDQMSRFVKNYLLTAIANRTVLIDLYLDNIIDKNTVVLNFGCGLDTRFNRYLHKVNRWYDIDLQNVIDFRKKLIVESDNYEMKVGSVLNESIFEKINAKNRVVTICEGLLMYFAEKEVEQYINRLISRTISGNIIIETLGKWASYGTNPLIKRIGTNSKYTWTLNKPELLLNLDRRLEFITSQSIFDINKERWNKIGKLMKLSLLKNRITSRISMYGYECQ